MKDLVLALMGSKHCEWCVPDKPATRWQRAMRFDQAMRTDSRPWYERAVMTLDDWYMRYVPIWKLGQWWHWHAHERID